MTEYIIQRKFTDEELLNFMREFLKDNDQLPPYLSIANNFKCSPNAITERLKKLEKKGIFQRNEVNKIMFARRES